MPYILRLMIRVTRVFFWVFLSVSLCSIFTFPQVSSHKDWQKLPGKCASCHKGHGVSGTAMLPIAEEEFCYQCHGDITDIQRSTRESRVSVTANLKNLRKEFLKPNRHPVELKSNRPLDFFSDSSGVFISTQSECLDCHRGHGVSQTPHSPGLSRKRSPKNENEFEFQLCYQCHARISQVSLAQKDIKTKFDTSNPSFHPVEASGKNMDVPSLISPYDISSVINCTDCHNNSDLAGPKGPHGSDFEFILERNYVLGDYASEGPQQYALCYKCHDRNSILGDQSFPYHNLHVVQVGTSCFSCHDSHGNEKYSHLIKYTEEVDPFRIQFSSSGRLEFFDTGRFSGECYLTCHGEDHNPKQYSNSSNF